MPHQMNNCNCGRKIHWPKTATVGDTWTCRRCGTRSRLVASGGDTRGRIIRSKKHKDATARPTMRRAKANRRNRQPGKRQRAQAGGCFPAETQILTRLGYRSLGQLVAGDLVLSVDKTSGRLIERPIIRVLQYGLRSLLEIRLQGSDRVIKCTAQHNLLTESGWRPAHRLRDGEKIFEHTDVSWDSLTVSTIESISVSDTKEAVFNLRTYGEANFIANGVPAHNFSHLKSLRSWFQNQVYLAFKTRTTTSAKNLIFQR